MGNKIECYYQLTRAQFESMIKSYVDHTIECVKNVLEVGAMRSENIDHVLLVGGSICIPYVQKRMEEFFNRSIDPDVVDKETAVTEGVAIYAHSLIVDGVDMCSQA